MEYHPEKHKLTHILTTRGENILQNLRYDYDGFSNLASRKDEERNLEEHFTYDHLNRLTKVWRDGIMRSWMEYDAYGRMTKKVADNRPLFSQAVFHPDKPHAMASASTYYGLFPDGEQNITYTSFDKVKRIVQDGNTIEYAYGYDQQRIWSYLMTSDNRFINKDYVGLCEYNTEYFVDGGAIQTTFTYLVGPYGVFAVVEKENNSESIHYILKDHLGSWTTITDSEGNVEQEISFDAWGNLRDPETWLNYPTDETTLSLMFDRGFTGHEHMTTFGLINMNGRCYDPLTSSFLSVDAYVQDPTNAQGFNRYAYCSYNPLRYTDPTGWYKQTGANPTPNINLIGTTTYHSDDPCEMLWGRSVHPCSNSSTGYINGTTVTSTGYTEGNEPSQNPTSSGITPKPIVTGEGYYLNIFTGTIEYSSGGENLLYNNGLLYMTSSDATMGDIEDVLNNWNLSYSTNPSVEGRYIVNTEAYIEGWNLWHTIPAMATFFAGMTADCFITTIASLGTIFNEIKSSNLIRIQERATKTVKLLKETKGGNVTVMKGESPVFRVHQPGTHGQENASITVFEKMTNPITKQSFNHPYQKVQPFSYDSYWKLKQAEKNRFGYYLKTKGGR